MLCESNTTWIKDIIELNLLVRPHHTIHSVIRAWRQGTFFFYWKPWRFWEGGEWPPWVEAALTSNIKVGWSRVASSCAVGCNTFIFALVWLLTVLYLQSSCTQTRWNRQFRLWQIWWPNQQPLKRKAKPHTFKVSSWISISWCSLDLQGTSMQAKIPGLLLETCEIDYYWLLFF